MKRLLISTLILFLMAALVDARGTWVKKRAGELEAEMRIDRNPPVLGDNNIEIEVKDSDGRTVTDAKVLLSERHPPVSLNLLGDSYGRI